MSQKETYSGSTAIIVVLKESYRVLLKNFVRWGDTIVPMQVIADLQEGFRELDLEELGTIIRGENLSNLRCIDNTALRSNSGDKLQLVIT